MEKQNLLADCESDLEKVRLWKDLLRYEDITIRNILSGISEDEYGDWVVGDNQTASYFLIPKFQREYSYTSKQKTSLIESILLSIPIGTIMVYPEITEEGMLTYPIIDGQHRIKTLYDFVNNKIVLNGKHLNILTSLAGKRFKDLEPEMKRSFMDYTLNMGKARDLGDNGYDTVEEYAIHCFIKMNESPNFMSPYTLYKAKYNSRIVNEYDSFITEKVVGNKELEEVLSATGRKTKDAFKLELTAVISIIMGGLSPKVNDSKTMAERLLKYLYQLNNDDHGEVLHYVKNVVDGYLQLLLDLKHKLNIKSPLTTDLFGVDKKESFGGVKRGIMLRLANAYYITHINGYDLTVDSNLKKFHSAVSKTFKIRYEGSTNNTLKFSNLKEFENTFSGFLEKELQKSNEKTNSYIIRLTDFELDEEQIS